MLHSIGFTNLTNSSYSKITLIISFNDIKDILSSHSNFILISLSESPGVPPVILICPLYSFELSKQKLPSSPSL